MGYYVINNLRKDKYMTQDKTKKLINELTNVESIKVVNIALELNKLQDKTTGQLIDVVKQMDANMKLLATKVLVLERKYERSTN
jgi:predicted nucleic acid-binding protein